MRRVLQHEHRHDSSAGTHSVQRQGHQNHDTQAHLMGPRSERGQGVRGEKSQRVGGENYFKYCEKKQRKGEKGK